jgi:hypothetical protein
LGTGVPGDNPLQVKLCLSYNFHKLDEKSTKKTLQAYSATTVSYTHKILIKWLLML